MLVEVAGDLCKVLSVGDESTRNLCLSLVLRLVQHAPRYTFPLCFVSLFDSLLCDCFFSTAARCVDAYLAVLTREFEQ